MTKEQEMQDIDVTVPVYPGRCCGRKGIGGAECKFLGGEYGDYCFLFNHSFTGRWPYKKIKKCREACEHKKGKR